MKKINVTISDSDDSIFKNIQIKNKIKTRDETFSFILRKFLDYSKDEK